MKKRCKGCERPVKYCECMPEGCEAVAEILPTYSEKDGSQITVPAVAVLYGHRKRRAVKGGRGKTPETMTSEVQYSIFEDEVVDGLVWPAELRASAFASFLNSESIFDCQVPRHFLGK